MNPRTTGADRADGAAILVILDSVPCVAIWTKATGDGENVDARLLVFCLTWCRCGLHAIGAGLLPVGNPDLDELS